MKLYKQNKFITLKSKEDNFDTNGYLSLKSTIDLFEKIINSFN